MKSEWLSTCEDSVSNRPRQFLRIPTPAPTTGVQHAPALSRWHARVAGRPSVRAVGRPPEFYERAYGALMTAFPEAASH
jgi:hypothetical protein